MIRNNSVSNLGGGIFLNGYNYNLDHLLVQNNSVSEGSGIYANNNTETVPEIENCTITENEIIDAKVAPLVMLNKR